ncbi:hypothetical protein ACFO1B_19585 [Dactylosporangium siamense]|uniref:Uncharacterized protein n=1 Tax=Dactylosporangium siamense TaxID=685454 RepID=A0A919PIK0_9ACTN|nr:hypothetical protein [Dactylosporangium siamense]GIG44087.1 hypothetical protein Dsi01nite_021280 [Dactylosporangium siamense]
MNRLWWWSGGIVGVLVVVVGYLVATGFPGRSDALAARQPGTCALLTGGPEGTTGQSTPYGAITSCQMLGRRTTLSGDPDGTVFVMLETDRGPVTMRVEYNGEGDAYTADAVEIPSWLAPGISGDTANRLKDGINQRGGLRAEPWRVHPAAS